VVSFYIGGGKTEMGNDPHGRRIHAAAVQYRKFPDRVWDNSNHGSVPHWLGAVDFAHRLSNGIARLFRLIVFIVQLRDAGLYKIEKKAQH
jgi:hypothetical protein